MDRSKLFTCVESITHEVVDPDDVIRTASCGGVGRGMDRIIRGLHVARHQRHLLRCEAVVFNSL